ncbi:MAG: hypothetical protein V1926_02055 [Candidatus Peregrinibacteria bacterium]
MAETQKTLLTLEQKGALEQGADPQQEVSKTLGDETWQSRLDLGELLGLTDSAPRTPVMPLPEEPKAIDVQGGSVAA